MTDVINEEENTNQLPDEEQESVVTDNGQTYESTESAIIAKQEADKAKLWAQESERQAGLSAGSATTAVEARDDAIAAKEYAEEAITDENLIVVATDLQATPSNIKTVATNISDVNTVAGIASDVTTVSSNTANISAVASNSTNINAVAGISSDVTAVAGNATNINAVNANKTNIDTVAGISSDVTAVAGNATNINAVAGDIANINAVAADLININNASTYANNANIWAEGTDEQVQALGGVHSSKGWADQSSQGQVQADWAEADSTEKSYIKNKPTNLVTTDTAQTIRADKSFSGSLYKDNTNLNIDTNPTTQINNQIWFRDKNGIGYAVIQANQLTSGAVSFSLMVKARSSNSYSSIGVIQKADGSTLTVAPTPASSDNSTKIATTAFVKSSSSGYSTYKSGASIPLNANYTVPNNGVIAGELSAAQNGWVHVDIDGVTVEQVGAEPSQRCRGPFYAIVKKGQVIKLVTSGNATVPLAKFYAFS